jgi:cobalt-zinc-cadmium efflux system outer membrane protein
MKQITVVWGLAAALLASCASVPRDAGLSEVRAAVDVRTGQTLDWTAANERIRAMAQDELTADEAVAIAVALNSRLQVALADLGIARADLIRASTIANPIFEFEVRYPAEPHRPFELRLAQSLFDLIQLPRRRALGRLAFDTARMRVTSSVLLFAADVRAAYYDVLAASQHVAMSRAITEAGKASAELALRQHEAQNITDLDFENEQARYEQAKLDLARAERELLVARETFHRALGSPDIDWRLPGAFPTLPAAEPDQAELERLAAAQRLDLEIARREEEIAARSVPVARLAAIGEAEVDVHYEREPGGERTVGPGIQIPIPIFNNGRAARTRAEAELLRARHLVRALTAESSSRLRAARATLTEARARVEYYRDVVVPRRKRILDLTKLEHNAMLVGIFQVLQAAQNEAQARRDLIDAQREYWSARVDLDRAVQGISRGEF